MEAAAEVRNVFALNVLGPALRGFQPPTGAFDPAGDWTHLYGVYTVGQRGCGRVGSLLLKRQAKGDGVALHLEYLKRYSGDFQGKTIAELRCRADALATPVHWLMTSESVAPKGQRVPNTRIWKKARVEGHSLVIRDKRATRRATLPAAWTVNWALFDAVQRLPREPFEPLHFTLFDDFDEVKPAQRLAYWHSVTVMLGGRRVQKHTWQQLEKGRIRKTVWAREGAKAVRLHGYVQTGPGIVPIVYWVDERGRLLFVVAGLEAYIYEPAKAQG